MSAPAPAMAEHRLTRGDTVDLLDPEGVTLARLTVTDVDGTNVAGTVAPQSGFSIVDHNALRGEPAAVSKAWPSGPVWALWVDAPVPHALRESTRAAAREAGATVAEIVAVPTGRETSRAANAPVRLAMAHTTREGSDRVIVVPWPELPWDAAGVQVRAALAAAYGATELIVADPGLARSDAVIPVRAAEVPPEQRSIALSMLDDWVLQGETLPDWAAEPQLAAEIAKVHRPSSRTGLTILLSGLSGSGKSTVARSLAVGLVEHESRSVTLLDGDVVRHHLSKGLGFSRPDRITNVLRIGFVASEITKAGGIAVCCPIAPYDETRKEVRKMVREHGQFVLVHVATPLAECERRDRKGLYAKARRGEIPEFTGISDPYETPSDAEVVIDTTGRTIQECVDEVYRYLTGHGLVER
ncbi:MAG: adenylyl-sulfate kinase [Actinomycetes bacterium]